MAIMTKMDFPLTWASVKYSYLCLMLTYINQTRYRDKAFNHGLYYSHWFFFKTLEMRRHRGHSLQIALEKLELFKHIGFVFNQGLCTPVFHPEAAFMDALTPGYICCSVKPTFIKSPESWSLSLSLQNHLYSYTNLSSLGCYPVHHFSVNRNHSCIKGQKCFAKEMYIAKEF